MLCFLASNTIAQINEEVNENSNLKAVIDSTQIASKIVSKNYERNHLIVANLIPYLSPVYSISYFQKMTESIDLGGSIQTPVMEPFKGVRIIADMRYHPFAKNMSGFYFGPRVSYFTRSGDDGGFSSFGIGISIGWQWFIKEKFAIGFAIDYDHYFKSKENPVANYGVPFFRFEYGYAW